MENLSLYNFESCFVSYPEPFFYFLNEPEDLVEIAHQEGADLPSSEDFGVEYRALFVFNNNFASADFHISNIDTHNGGISFSKSTLSTTKGDEGLIVTANGAQFTDLNITDVHGTGTLKVFLHGAGNKNEVRVGSNKNFQLIDVQAGLVAATGQSDALQPLTSILNSQVADSLNPFKYQNFFVAGNENIKSINVVANSYPKITNCDFSKPNNGCWRNVFDFFVQGEGVRSRRF